MWKDDTIYRYKSDVLSLSDIDNLVKITYDIKFVIIHDGDDSNFILKNSRNYAKSNRIKYIEINLSVDDGYYHDDLVSMIINEK